MAQFMKMFERVIVITLIILMMVVIVASTFELGRVIYLELVTGPVLLDINSLLDIFGIFLLILIGVELLETIRAYLQEHVVHVEIVIEVALIAVARKVVILDVKELPSLTLIGIAALILAMAVAFFFIKRYSHQVRAEQKEQPSSPIQETKNTF